MSAAPVYRTMRPSGGQLDLCGGRILDTGVADAVQHGSNAHSPLAVRQRWFLCLARVQKIRLYGLQGLAYADAYLEFLPGGRQ